MTSTSAILINIGKLRVINRSKVTFLVNKFLINNIVTGWIAVRRQKYLTSLFGLIDSGINKRLLSIEID